MAGNWEEFLEEFCFDAFQAASLVHKHKVAYESLQTLVYRHRIIIEEAL